jgi:hypothetical protein
LPWPRRFVECLAPDLHIRILHQVMLDELAAFVTMLRGGREARRGGAAGARSRHRAAIDQPSEKPQQAA